MVSEFFVDYRGGPTQKVKRGEGAQGDGEEVGWCKRRVLPWTLSAQALVMIDVDNARARRHGRFPPLAVRRDNLLSLCPVRTVWLSRWGFQLGDRVAASMTKAGPVKLAIKTEMADPK